jgi:hypothetical protein
MPTGTTSKAEFQRRAAQARRAADAAKTPEVRAAFNKIATEWDLLAEEATKKEK